jgi:hypothetical protein
LIDKQDQAKAVIAENQEVQKRAQNQALNVSDKVIEPGTLVNIRNDGINSKLDPIFKGPYTVVEMDNKQNYTLKHATGEVLKETIPRQKIKIINKKVDNNTYEVEKILDHKIENNITYYHVKWRGYDETTWEPEVNFNTMGVINKYKRDIKNGKPNKNLEPTRKSTRIKTINYLRMWISLIIWTQALCYEIKSPNIRNLSVKIPYCRASSQGKPIDIEDLCVANKTRNMQIEEKILKMKYVLDHINERALVNDRKWTVYKPFTVDVYTKIQQTVLGKGFECKKSKIHWTFTETFFGERYESSIEEIIHLKPYECWAMQESKLCHENVDLTCDGNYCSVFEKISANYSWWSEKKISTYNCIITPRLITAEKLDEHLFGMRYVRFGFLVIYTIQ